MKSSQTAAGKLLLVLLTIALSFAVTDAAIRKRQAENARGTEVFEVQSGEEEEANDLSLPNLVNMISRVPYFGRIIKDILNYVGETIIRLDLLTNGILARILGGSLPCVIDIDAGVVCSGTSTEGVIYEVIEDSVQGIPSGIFPQFAKDMLLDGIKATVNPVLDALFGGVPKNQGTPEATPEESSE